MAPATWMPPAASWASGRHQPPSVSASSPYVSEPPSTGLPLSLGMLVWAPRPPPPPPPPPPHAAATRAKPAATATTRSHRLRVTRRYESRTSFAPQFVGSLSRPVPQRLSASLDRPVQCDGRHSRTGRHDVNRGPALTRGLAGGRGYRAGRAMAPGDGHVRDPARRAGVALLGFGWARRPAREHLQHARRGALRRRRVTVALPGAAGPAAGSGRSAGAGGLGRHAVPGP